MKKKSWISSRTIVKLIFIKYLLQQKERNVDEEIPCLRLLLHWNSGISEGLGESHELLERRLRQLGHRDLADWLGKTTFQELGKDLQRAINEPFPEAKSSIDDQDETTYVRIVKEKIYTFYMDW